MEENDTSASGEEIISTRHVVLTLYQMLRLSVLHVPRMRGMGLSALEANIFPCKDILLSDDLDS